jgi:hypothetical protein
MPEPQVTQIVRFLLERGLRFRNLVFLFLLDSGFKLRVARTRTSEAPAAVRVLEHHRHQNWAGDSTGRSSSIQPPRTSFSKVRLRAIYGLTEPHDYRSVLKSFRCPLGYGAVPFGHEVRP